MGAELQSDPLVAARAIMTTDTVPKALSLSVGAATLSAVGKGAGMIAPNMATMLVYIFTDAELAPGVADPLLRAAVADSFNMLSVDTDTSTSDTCVLMANGLAGPVDERAFAEALNALCIRMAERCWRGTARARRSCCARRSRVHAAWRRRGAWRAPSSSRRW